jgi:hypothetical protein
MARTKPGNIGAYFVLGALLLCAPLLAQDHNTYLQHAVRFAVSPPLRELAGLPQPSPYGFHIINPVGHVPKRPSAWAGDPVEQRSVPSDGVAYSIGANFVGVGTGFPNYHDNSAPPDTTMAVGDFQIVQWVDLSYTVCEKTAPYNCEAAVPGNALWSNLGGPCAANNAGDIIAQWDVQAHRWLLTQNVFVGTYGVCVAISQTNDATGSYFLYEFPVLNGGFPDYTKWGAWPPYQWAQTWNNYGPNMNGFVGPVMCIYNRIKLLAGDPSTEQLCHQYSVNEDSLLPADADSTLLPPAGEAQFAMGGVADIDYEHLSLYSAKVNDPSDWTQGATFTGDNNSQLIAVATYYLGCLGSDLGFCVPQPGQGATLEGLGDRLMYRLAYSVDQPPPNARATPPLPAPAQHWLVNHSVIAGGQKSGIRWYEFTAPIRNVPVTQLSVFQQGTYNPDLSNWRWMGSIARDKKGDILLGYNESSSTQYPSVYIAGRQVNDPLGLGNLEAETLVVAGTGSQTDTSNRWGDYSTMRIDTNDGHGGCTFWYTQEYYMMTASFAWSSQINSARFSNCN